VTAVSDLRIRPADLEGGDVEHLIRVFGQLDYFQDRASRQKAGQGALLIAWTGDLPVGDAYLWWQQAEEPEIRAHLDGVPLLTHLEVREDLRSRGIGGELINRAEQELSERGHRRVALAVEQSNERAVRLYERCGYREWKYGKVHCAPYDDGSAASHSAEVCRVFVKDLVVPRKWPLARVRLSAGGRSRASGLLKRLRSPRAEGQRDSHRARLPQPHLGGGVGSRPL
jgi:GNAT superfamily N-acetyltransferase